MTSWMEVLLRCPLFEGIAQPELAGLLDCLGARRMRFARGETVLAEGTQAREAGLVLSGQVQVIRTDYYGNRSIMLSAGAGQLFAEAFACGGAIQMPVSVVAGEESEVLLLDCSRLMTTCSCACSFHSRIVFNLMRIMSQKNLMLHRRAMIISHRTTREKVMAYLLLQAKEAGSPVFTVPFDRQGMADYLEVDRSGLSAELSKLKKEGVLDYHRSSFRLLGAPGAMAGAYISGGGG